MLVQSSWRSGGSCDRLFVAQSVEKDWWTNIVEDETTGGCAYILWAWTDAAPPRLGR
jgi:hypothetical protein